MASNGKGGNSFGVPLETYNDYGATDDTSSLANKDFLNTAEDEGPLDFNTKQRNDDPGTYFTDGRRKIDFILVTEEEKLTEKQQQKKDKEKREQIEAGEEDTDVLHDKWKKKFLHHLARAGVEMEEDVVESEKKIVTYVKLHAPWSVLVFYAEELSFKAPLQAHPNPSSNWSSKVLDFMHIPNMMAQKVPNQPLDYFTCAFKRSKLEKFLGSEDKEHFFSNTERSAMVNEILQTATYGKRKRAEIGIDRLISEEVFMAAYPLHDGPYKKPEHYVSEDSLNKRQILHEYWGRWGCWTKYQPLDHIREYFGEKIGIYFAWLGFYTAWLLPASVIGVIVFCYGIVTIGNNVPAQEICDSTEEFLMCPLCDEQIGCPYWNLSDTCSPAQLAYLFDHEGTVFFAIFMSFWAVSFLEYWKRKQVSLAHHWDVLGFEEEDERPRPEFCAKAPCMEANPITGVMEPYFPDDMRARRWLTGLGILCGMVVIVIIFMLGVIMYRVLISIPLFQNQALRSQAQSIASMSSAVVNLILIMSLGQVYQLLAQILNDWEMHRTQTEYEDNLTFKVFIFQFCNFYSSIFYIAFFKGKFVGYPGNYTRIFGLRTEECANGGCLVELAQQLLVIMVGKQMINNCQEVAVPKIKQFIQRWKLKGSMDGRDSTRWEEDYQLVENEGLFEEYLEMILQFGFITIFVASFPLAPLFALLNNWIEIRLDGAKYLCEVRRPVAERAEDIGIWFSILDAIAQIAVVSNAFLIAFTSDFLSRALYKFKHDGVLDGYTNYTLSTSPEGSMTQTCRYLDYRDETGGYTVTYFQLFALKLLFVIVFEHFVFGVGKLIDMAVPDVPESLEVKIKREAYMAKQALSDIVVDRRML